MNLMWPGLYLFLISVYLPLLGAYFPGLFEGTDLVEHSPYVVAFGFGVLWAEAAFSQGRVDGTRKTTRSEVVSAVSMFVLLIGALLLNPWDDDNSWADYALAFVFSLLIGAFVSALLYRYEKHFDAEAANMALKLLISALLYVSFSDMVFSPLFLYWSVCLLGRFFALDELQSRPPIFVYRALLVAVGLGLYPLAT